MDDGGKNKPSKRLHDAIPLNSFLFNFLRPHTPLLLCHKPPGPSLPNTPTLTCHHAGEGTADRHRREGAGGAAERRHDGRRAAEGRERGAHAVAAVAAVVHLGSGGVAHEGGSGP